MTTLKLTLLIAYLLIVVFVYVLGRYHDIIIEKAGWRMKDRWLTIFIGLVPVINILFLIFLLHEYVVYRYPKYWNKEVKW